jgi:hypothetical protein
MYYDPDLKECGKDTTDTISHTCLAPEFCVDASLPDSVLVGETHEGWSSNEDICMKVPLGGTAYFIVKDSNECADDFESSLSGGYEVKCEPLMDPVQGVNTCSGNGQGNGKKSGGVECAWTVVVPDTCGNSGGGSGDPHFMLFNRTRYGFQGECDLVMLSNPEYHDNIGMDIHLRTTIHDFFSFIENAAIRIGEKVFEFEAGNKDSFYLNGEAVSREDLPLEFDGHYMDVPHTVGTADIFRIDLPSGGYVQARVHNRILSVDVQAGVDEEFEKSVGMLGDYHTGKMLSRDQTRIIDIEDEFGLEWQVRSDDAMLFRTVRAPQWPQQCNLPAITERHLKLYDDEEKVDRAEELCAHKNGDDFDWCLFDVLAMEDESVAGAW